MTTSAENADRIKAISKKNNGHAAPMMADYIINNGGLRMVLKTYDRWRSKLLAIWPNTPSGARFVSKFPALFLTTAELAKAALGITFHEQEIINFFLDYEAQHGNSRNSSKDSYEMLMSQCKIHEDKFYIRNDKSYAGGKAQHDQAIIPRSECWGRITNMLQPFPGNRVVVQEIEIYNKIVEQLLRENGFSNKKTCQEAWKAADVLDYLDDTHPCRKRKLDPHAPEGTKDQVYVFRKFCEPENLEGHLETIKKRQEQQQKVKTKVLSMKNRAALLEEGGEDDDKDAHTA